MRNLVLFQVQGTNNQLAHAELTDFPLKSDRWYMLTGTYDGQVARLYIDGVLMKQHSLALTPLTSDDPVTIASAVTYHSALHGLVDDVQVYDVRLGIGQINYLHEAGRVLRMHLKLDSETQITRSLNVTTPDSSHYAFPASRRPPNWDPLPAASLFPGVFGQCANFTGSSAGLYTAVDNGHLRLGRRQTISAWVKVREHVNDWVRVVGKGTSPNRNYGLWIHNGAKQVLFQIEGSGTSANARLSNVTLQAGRWYSLIGTYDGTTAKLYIDGIERASHAIRLVPGTSNEPVTIGGGPNHSKLKGWVDDVRIYSATGSSVIQAIMAPAGSG